jgi:hypothetical protein
MGLQESCPVLCKVIKSKVRCIFSRCNHLTSFVLMPLDMTLSDVHATFSTFISEGARPENCAEILKSSVAMDKILLFKNLLCGSY